MTAIEKDSLHPLSKPENYTSSILDGLPTLDDVLHRQSQPPVCLYNYYIVLRDRLEMETLLDFWLDVAQADILYKRYIKHASRRGSTPKFNNNPSMKPSVDYHRLSQPSSPLSVHNRTSDILTHMLLLHPRASLAPTMNTMTTTNSTNKKPPPTQVEMMETVERIYLRYIVPSAEKELSGLPSYIKESISHHFTVEIKQKVDNPMIYAQAKNYVHQLLESTFPLFLRYKAFMNLTLPQQIGRLGFGLILLLIGFSLEFSLIFLDVRPWQKRLWVKSKSNAFFCVCVYIFY
ncbi:hypothetical protein BD770DRAFT_372469 [Pilaira anomala]|nr:hypothetical protein BD770DRAFT_372469 [Pilaira anomala]